MKKKLSIKYSHNLALASVYPDPIIFTQLAKFFPDFKFIVGDDKAAQYTVGPFEGSSIAEHLVGVKTTAPKRGMTEQKNFLAYAKRHPKTKYVLYAPKDPPYLVNPLSLLMNSPALARAYENKRYFRDEFDGLIRMPEYVIRHINELSKVASFRELRDRFEGAFVIQDEESSGSKGTFIVKSYDDYVDAVASLKRNSSGRSLVISKFVAGQTYSTQVCITKYGIFTAGIQRQLVDEPLLCNMDMDVATRWCGGVLGDEYPDIVQHQTQEIATIIGSELASHGYKGIFGIDLIITPENEVYAIEINARLTGYSHLISDVQQSQGKVPFMLLHVLELLNIDYEVENLDELPSQSNYKRPLSYMILNNILGSAFVPKQLVKPGLYTYDSATGISYMREEFSVNALKGDGTILIQSGLDPDSTVVQPGKRVLKIVRNGRMLTKTGALNRQTKELIYAIREHIGLHEK